LPSYLEQRAWALYRQDNLGLDWAEVDTTVRNCYRRLALAQLREVTLRTASDELTTLLAWLHSGLREVDSAQLDAIRAIADEALAKVALLTGGGR
jgi:hypothetical protein